uniref:Uncharacterized protein n=1 Tax=Globodera rostochiensis TaxID=31243 RepID=A0A914GUB8_GLORO
MKNGEKKSQEVGPSKANVLKTAVVGVLALGGGIGLANGAQPAASGASFNNNLTSATNQHLFKPSTGYEPPPMKPFTIICAETPSSPFQRNETEDSFFLFVLKKVGGVSSSE